jgi:hypothetical protein
MAGAIKMFISHPHGIQAMVHLIAIRL